VGAAAPAVQPEAEGPGPRPGASAPAPLPAALSPAAVGAQPAADAGKPSPEPAESETWIQSKPDGAAVILGGDEIGRTPYKLGHPAAGAEVRLLLRLSGYRDATVVVRAEAGEIEPVQLVRKPGKAAAPAARDSEKDGLK
jgi:hypothetical protein